LASLNDIVGSSATLNLALPITGILSSARAMHSAQPRASNIIMTAIVFITPPYRLTVAADAAATVFDII
jgi:hypothetical protein